MDAPSSLKGGIIIPVLQTGQPELTEVKGPGKGHVAIWWQKQDCNCRVMTRSVANHCLPLTWHDCRVRNVSPISLQPPNMYNLHTWFLEIFPNPIDIILQHSWKVQPKQQQIIGQSELFSPFRFLYFFLQQKAAFLREKNKSHKNLHFLKYETSSLIQLHFV